MSLIAKRLKHTMVSLPFLFLSQLSFAVQNDPCNNLAGNWEGKWYGTCTCDLTIEVSVYNDEYRFIDHFRNCSKHCSSATAFEYATCKDSKISFIYDKDNAKGQIIDNTLTIEVGKQNAVLHKK